MLATANTREIGRGFGKMQVNGPEGWKLSKEEIPGSKRGMYGYNTDLLQALKGERLNSVFSPDGTLISASAAPHCGGISIGVTVVKV